MQKYIYSFIIAIRGKPYPDCAMKGDYGTNASDVSKELVSFLQYVTDSTDTCVERTKEWKLRRIHERIKVLKQSRKLEEGYMQLGELLKREHDEGMRQMLELVSRMIADGKTDFVPRLKEEAFYQEMLKKYHLEV